MIDLYYWTTPNGHKITIFLEEAGLRYKIIPLNISQGDQFRPEFLAISPNNRIPAIVDRVPKDGGKPIPASLTRHPFMGCNFMISPEPTWNAASAPTVGASSRRQGSAARPRAGVDRSDQVVSIPGQSQTI